MYLTHTTISSNKQIPIIQFKNGVAEPTLDARHSMFGHWAVSYANIINVMIERALGSDTKQTTPFYILPEEIVRKELGLGVSFKTTTSFIVGISNLCYCNNSIFFPPSFSRINGRHTWNLLLSDSGYDFFQKLLFLRVVGSEAFNYEYECVFHKDATPSCVHLKSYSLGINQIHHFNQLKNSRDDVSLVGIYRLIQTGFFEEARVKFDEPNQAMWTETNTGTTVPALGWIPFLEAVLRGNQFFCGITKDTDARRNKNKTEKIYV